MDEDRGDTERAERPEGSPRPGEMDRRSALKLLGAGGLVAATPPQLHLTGARASRTARRALLESLLRPSLAGALKPTLQAFVYRRDDLLDVRFDLYNLVLDTIDAARSWSERPLPDPAFVVAVFPFQQVAEEAVDTTMTSRPWPAPPLHAVGPGPSQIAYLLPKSVLSLPFTLAGLLDWTELIPQLGASQVRPERRPAAARTRCRPSSRRRGGCSSPPTSSAVGTTRRLR